MRSRLIGGFRRLVGKTAPPSAGSPCRAIADGMHHRVLACLDGDADPGEVGVDVGAVRGRPVAGQGPPGRDHRSARATLLLVSH